MRHGQYNQYVIKEVVPFIYENCNGEVPIITTSASLGAYHAMNTFLRLPSVFRGTIAMSGVYELKEYSKGHYNDHVYYNSPIDFSPNVHDEDYFNQMRNNLGVIIASGQGEFEDPSASISLSNILHSKDIKHDWSTWREILPYFLGKI